MSYRAGDGDRERTAELLRQAAGDGRITLDELDTRLNAAFGARTYAELAEVTADLPTDPVPAPPVPVEEKPLLLLGKGGSVKRKGRWWVPQRIVIDRRHGSVRLDFRQAEFSAPLTDVEVQMTHGSLTLILPDGATAALECTTEWGSAGSTVPGVPSAGHPHLVISGEKKYGSLKVRYGYGYRWRSRR